MDIHRCRFVPYQPSAINAVAFSHPKAKSAIHGAIAKLAVGRANGDIEIWNPSSGTWHQELVIRGGKGRSIDGLVWVNDLDQDLEGGRVVVGRSRLFSIGYTSTITEWDLEKGKPKRHASAQHGDIWCLAAQPAGPAGVGGSDGTLPSNKLLAGTVHGELAMYSVEDGDLRFQRMLVKSPTKRVHMVSMTFQSRKMVIVGCADSTIRAYDLTHGHMVRRMTLGSDLVGGAKHIIVWSVKCLPNGNIVSGDSTGQICIWDGKTYTQTQRIQSHKQDVLSLAISADGNSIMSGGMDRRTFLYKQNDDGGRWSKAWGRRYHNHDVKAMASFEFKSMSVVVSGGPDAHLTVVPLKEMRRENHRNMSCLPQQPPIASASNARFMVSWWDRQVHVWALRRPATELFKSAADEVNINENRKLLKSIVIKGDSNITSAAVDKDGRFLVVSTATDVKAFHLRHRAPAKPCDVAVAAVELPHKLSHLGASRVVLSPDGRWLCLIQEGSRVLMAVVDAGDQDSPSISGQPQRLTRLHREVPRYILNGGLGSYDRNITQVAFSADSEMLAVADLAGFIDTWVLRTAEGARRKGGGGDSADEDEAASSSDSSSSASGDEAERWIRNPAGKQLPKLPSVPVVLSFSDHMPGRQGQQASRQEEADGTGDYVLAAITTSWHVLAFHPRRGSLTTWARRHGRSSLPAAVQELVDLPKGILWQGSRMWAYGVSFLLMLDLGQDLPRPSSEAKATGERQVAQGTKRKRHGGATTGAGGIKEKEMLAPHKIRKHGGGEQYEEVEVGRTAREQDGSDSDEEVGEADGELCRLRNARGGGNGEAAAAAAATAAGTAPRQPWWITHKYRPILGIVPLNGAGQPLEVALVERPAWDLEMPDRYFGGDEWER